MYFLFLLQDFERELTHVMAVSCSVETVFFFSELVAQVQTNRKRSSCRLFGGSDYALCQQQLFDGIEVVRESKNAAVSKSN